MVEKLHMKTLYSIMLLHNKKQATLLVERGACFITLVDFTDQPMAYWWTAVIISASAEQCSISVCSFSGDNLDSEVITFFRTYDFLTNYSNLSA